MVAGTDPGRARAPLRLKPIYLAGPTACGKSAVALSLAERLGGEILSVDSMQVYRGLDLGTAKASSTERARIPHHLLDLVGPSESFDVAQWLDLARSCLLEVVRRSGRPIFCGGTGLYFRAWFEGLESVPPSDPVLRTELEALPLPRLLEELAARAPEVLARIDRQNPRRVVRAVEILRLGGTTRQRLDPVTPSEKGPKGPVIVLRRTPVDLRRRIEARVDAMFEGGLVEETRRLLEQGLEQNRTAMQAIGYRQVVEYLRGMRDLAATVALVKARTWQLGRRQMTWFRHQLPVEWLDVPEDEKPEVTADRVVALLEPPGGDASQSDGGEVATKNDESAALSAPAVAEMQPDPASETGVPPLRVRRLMASDVPFADALRQQTGWNQTVGDWRRFLDLEPEGCFLAEWNGERAGTATTLSYGVELAWVGMVLVLPQYRRRGIGRALLLHALAYLRDRRVRCVKLDATPMGRPVYASLGFREEWTLTRWEHPGWRGSSSPPDSTRELRYWQEGDGARLEALDRAAFGVTRRRLVEALTRQSRAAVVAETLSGQLTGYGLLRDGARALYLGPVVATDAETGLGIVDSLLANADGRPVFWDLPDGNLDGTSWARRRGFVPQRSLTRMSRGEPASQGDVRALFGLTGPETG